MSVITFLGGFCGHQKKVAPQAGKGGFTGSSKVTKNHDEQGQSSPQMVADATKESSEQYRAPKPSLQVDTTQKPALEFAVQAVPTIAPHEPPKDLVPHLQNKQESLIPKFLVMSTFRDSKGERVRPHGLQWGMPARSQMTYVFAPAKVKTDAFDIDCDSVLVRQGIVQAHNFWCFAKTNARGGALPFVELSDMEDVSRTADGRGVRVRWKVVPDDSPVYPGGTAEVLSAIKKELLALESGRSLLVYLNGVLHSSFNGSCSEESMGILLQAVQKLHSIKLCLRRSPNVLRVERYFRGMVSGEEIFEHVMDNLHALEDAQILDAHTIIGTATLPDWIMGGQLTSRLWVQDRAGDVLALRPLYNDNVESNVDRRYRLTKGKSDQDDRRIGTMRKVLSDIRYLASIDATSSARSSIAG